MDPYAEFATSIEQPSADEDYTSVAEEVSDNAYQNIAEALPQPGFAFFNREGEAWKPEHGEENKFEFPTQEHFFSESYKEQKEAQDPGIIGTGVEVAKTMLSGAGKALLAGPRAAVEIVKGKPLAALQTFNKALGSGAESVLQGIEMTTDIEKTLGKWLGTPYARATTSLLGTRNRLEKNLKKEEYATAKEQGIRQMRRWGESGESILGDSVRDLDKDFAKFVDSNVDQEMALAMGMAGAVPLGLTKAIGNAYKLYKAGNLAKATEEIAAASKAYKASKIPPVLKTATLGAPPVITPVQKLERGIAAGVERAKETFAKPLSKISGVLDQPFSTALQVGGRALRKTGEATGRVAEELIKRPGLLSGLAGGVTLAETEDPWKALLAAGGTYMGGSGLAKAKAFQGLSARMGTLGDLVEAVGTASKMGGGKTGILGAARLAKTDIARKAMTLAAGLTPAEEVGKLAAFGGFAAKEGLSAVKHLGDPLVKGVAEGAVIVPLSTGNLDDVDSGIAFGVPMGLSAHGFGYLARPMMGVPKNAESALRYTRGWLNTKSPEERKLLTKQSPVALHAIADLESIAKGFGGQDAKVVYHSPETFRKMILGMGETEMAAESPGVFIQPKTASEPPTVHVQADMALAAAPHEILGHLFAHLDSMTGIDNLVLADSKQRFRETLLGTDVIDENGNPTQRPPLYDSQSLRRIAERYYTPLGRSPETIVKDGLEVLTPEETVRVLQEIESETGRFFSHDVLRSGSDVASRALGILKASDKELQSDILKTTEQFGLSSLLGSDFKMTPEILRGMAQKVLDSMSVTSPKGFFSDVGIPEGAVVVQPATWKNMADKASTGVETAKTPEELLKASREMSELVDSEVYGTRLKTAGEIQREAAVLAQAKLGRAPTQTEIRQEMSNINPREIVNDKGGKFKPGDMPMLLTKKEQDAVTGKYNTKIREAVEAAGAQDDPSAVRVYLAKDGKPVFGGRYFTPEQIQQLRMVNPQDVPKHHIDNIIQLNREMAQGTGRAFDFMYHKAISKRGNVPRQKYVGVPFAWYGSKADNVVARTFDRTAFAKALANEASKSSSAYLNPFREFGDEGLQPAANRFQEKFFQYLDNHVKGLPGETELSPDPTKATAMKNAINGFLGVSKDVNPLAVESKFIKSFRDDRMFNARVSGADPTPVDYQKWKMNFMPSTENKGYKIEFTTKDGKKIEEIFPIVGTMNAKAAFLKKYPEITDADWVAAKAINKIQMTDLKTGEKVPKEMFMPSSLDTSSFMEKVGKATGQTDEGKFTRSLDPYFWLSKVTLPDFTEWAKYMTGTPRGSDLPEVFAKDENLLTAYAKTMNEAERIRQGGEPIADAWDLAKDKNSSLFMPLASSNERFYSTLKNVVAEKMPEKASAEQVLNILKGGVVKADEIHWTGIEDFLQGREKVSKTEVLNYLDNEGKIRIEEAEMSNQKSYVEPYSVEDISQELRKYEEELIRLNNLHRYSENWPEADAERMRQWDVRILDMQEANAGRYSERDIENVFIRQAPKFADYSLPGGENYRELVMSLPEKSLTSEEIKRFQEYDRRDFASKHGTFRKDISTELLTPEEQKDYQNLKQRAEQNKASTYTSSHFPDVPNYLAHLRMNDRLDGAGKRGLFIEELQSDRHQAGRENGYKTEEKVSVTPTPENPEIEITRVSNPEGVAPAPFSKTWHEFLFKRALAEAIETGKDWVGWTTGETQVARYDLSKQIDELKIWKNDKKGTVDILATRDGQGVLSKGDVSLQKLRNYIGKDLTRKIQESSESVQIFSGNDLKVGGHGMHEFYDKILPRFAEKYVKKWDGKVEQGEIASNEKGWIVLNDDNVLALKPSTRERAQEYLDTELQGLGTIMPAHVETTKIWKLPITDKMRSEIRQRGQAMFMPSSKTILPSLNLPVIVDSPTFPVRPPTNEQEEFGFKNLVLALTLLGEARGEQAKHNGMNAVAQVILNRAKDNGTEPVQEALKPKQFSFWNDPISAKKARELLLTDNGKIAITLAKKINSGITVDSRVGDSLNYHTTKISPRWVSPQWKFSDIGNHRFYHNMRKSVEKSPELVQK